jgi:PIN domain nuclease of toxin-antitoxin system
VRLLLDTHIWLWSLLAPERLAPNVASVLEAADSELWLSPISIWELTVLVQKGRVALDRHPEAWVAAALARVPLREAVTTHGVAIETTRIALPHRDPADHLIAATARVFGLILVTADARLLGVEGVPTLANAG